MDKTTARSSSTAAGWNYPALLTALGISFVLQMLFLPCFCYQGEIKGDFALMFDAFVLLRIIIAALRKERGRTWLFYAMVLYTSPVWITILVAFMAQM